MKVSFNYCLLYFGQNFLCSLLILHIILVQIYYRKLGIDGMGGRFDVCFCYWWDTFRSVSGDDCNRLQIFSSLISITCLTVFQAVE